MTSITNMEITVLAATLGKSPAALMSRTDVRQYRCPKCGAEVGEKCRGAREKTRESNHLERVFEAIRSCWPEITRLP